MSSIMTSSSEFLCQFFVRKFGLLSSIHLPSLVRVCHVFLKLLYAKISAQKGLNPQRGTAQ